MAKAIYDVQVPNIGEVERALGDMRDKAPRAMKNAVNQTATRAKNMMIRQARLRYAVNSAGRRHLNALKVRNRATTQNPTAEIFISSRRNDLGATDARGSVTLNDFAKELPQQFVECGIAEQDAVGISAGLAHSGKKVFVCGPACFYVARSLEQVKVDLAYSQNNVKILGVSGGVAYGALGATHHSLHDIAVLRTFPGMNIVLPCDARQTKKLVEFLIDYPEPVYVRVGRAAVPDVYENDDFDFAIGKANRLLDGTDLTIIGTGETVYHAHQAALELRKYGISVRVLDMSFIKPCDEEAVLKAASETGRIITVEEHSQYGGLGAMVTEIISENPVPVKILGIPDENVVHGSSSEIFAHYGLDAPGIVKTTLDFLK